MSRRLDALPCLGAGLGLRPEIRADILRHKEDIDFLEIIADNYLDHPARQDSLARMGEHFTLIPHGLNLSIGRATPLDGEYLRKVKQVSDLCRSPYYSDHMALTSVPGTEIGHLSPVWRTEESLRHVIANVDHVQDVLGKPLVLEYITYNLDIPNATMSVPEFFARVTERTGCGILLDVSNLHINACNHRFDPLAFLDGFPVDAVVQVHLAGGSEDEEYLVDSHDAPVPPEHWDLLAELAGRTAIKGIIVERDGGFGDFADLVGEVNRARSFTPQPAPAG